jgi:DNA topoisomerase-1
MGIDVEHDFRPEYHVIPSKEKALGELKKAAAGAERVYLATDPDREGEAIAWHLSEELRHPDAVRVLFNEITKKAIQEAIAHPLALDQKMYDSQQTRRILDRLVGYQISPLLWKKVRRGLSAGRVQSVAVRLIVEREREIKAFVPVEYWTLEAELEGKSPPPFRARLAKLDGKKAEVADKATADALLEELRKADYRVETVERRERRRNAAAPFITSKLQQEAANRLHFTAKKTMTLAQRLYEGVELGDEGQTALITYMRTDSVRLSDDAVKAARAFIADTYGKDALPDEPMVYKSRKSAQDAHEAIRPVSMEWTPDRVRPFLEPDMARLYELIWNRFVACQMKPAVYDQTTVEISAGRATFRAAGSILKFAGYLAVYGMVPTTDEESDKQKEGDEPASRRGQRAAPRARRGRPAEAGGQGLRLRAALHPASAAFTEASLVKELEEDGIGRPSTYALDPLGHPGQEVRGEDRGPVPSHGAREDHDRGAGEALPLGDGRHLHRRDGGAARSDLRGRGGLAPGAARLLRTVPGDAGEGRAGDARRQAGGGPTDVNCEKCGKMMAIKWGKMGRFLACTGTPTARTRRTSRRSTARSCRSRRRRPTRPARSAAGRWSSSAGGSGASWPAPGTRSARAASRSPSASPVRRARWAT